MTDILITTYFRKDFTGKVLDHIIGRTKLPVQFIIVDNGSKDGTREMLEEYQKIYPSLFKKVIFLDKNIGLQAAKNIGMEFVEGKYFVNTDNDCLCPQLDPDWLAQLIELMGDNPDYAAISLRPQVLVGVGPIFRGAGVVVANNVAGGSFRIMLTEAVRKVGQWHDSFENRNEEWHICNALRRAGYKVGYARDLFCYHMFGSEWGYPQGIEHYHAPERNIYSKDEAYDPITMKSLILHNE